MNDVQIQVERGEDVFLGTQGQILVPEKQLRVHDHELQYKRTLVFFIIFNYNLFYILIQYILVSVLYLLNFYI